MLYGLLALMAVCIICGNVGIVMGLTVVVSTLAFMGSVVGFFGLLFGAKTGELFLWSIAAFSPFAVYLWISSRREQRTNRPPVVGQQHGSKPPADDTAKAEKELRDLASRF